MSQSFDYSSESGRIAWSQTIGFNMIRTGVGGIIIALIALIATHDISSLVFIISAPIGWLVCGLPAWLICQKLPDKPKGIVALIFVLPFLIIGLVGDPVIFIVSKIKPQLIPVENPGFMSVNAVLFVLKP
jgi:hypothetical protein